MPCTKLACGASLLVALTSSGCTEINPGTVDGQPPRHFICPEPWAQSQCLGSSSYLGQRLETQSNATIRWNSIRAGDHTHYNVDPKKTAMFVIDAQKVYSACPELTGSQLDFFRLTKLPSDPTLAGQSPLCCEQFDTVVDNQNKIAARARMHDMPVFVTAHIYRDFDGDQQVDNCGRTCDFDVLGWMGWPMAWHLWHEEYPWHAVEYKNGSRGFDADFQKDYYTEKSTYSAMTEPVVAKLKERGIDTVVITGFMTNFASSTTARHAHDLGFKVIFVTDANDGPKVMQLLAEGLVDENKVTALYLGVTVADTTTTDELLKQLE